MARRGWKGMMIVVPAYFVTEDAKDPIVARVVVRLKVARTELMTDRIDRPGFEERHD